VRSVIETILMIACIGIFLFLATYGAFFYYKEKDCAVSIYAISCYRTYPQFLEMLQHGQFAQLGEGDR
jgi:hypothetical protein